MHQFYPATQSLSEHRRTTGYSYGRLGILLFDSSHVGIRLLIVLTDPYTHANIVQGVFRGLAKAFIRTGRQPSVKQTQSPDDQLTPVMPRILSDAAATDPFNSRAFRDVVVFTMALDQAI